MNLFETITLAPEMERHETNNLTICVFGDGNTISETSQSSNNDKEIALLKMENEKLKSELDWAWRQIKTKDLLIKALRRFL